MSQKPLSELLLPTDQGLQHVATHYIQMLQEADVEINGEDSQASPLFVGHVNLAKLESQWLYSKPRVDCSSGDI